MPRHRMLSCVALFVGAVFGWQKLGADRIGRHSFEAREVARLRRHFAVVEGELLAHDVTNFTAAQLAARAAQVRLLRRYAREGAFPRNDHFPGRRVPIFRDSQGNLCAMAFLIAASGRGDIVDRVARSRNNAYLPDLTDEPGLVVWLDQHGLTIAEAARIQPTYGGEPSSDDPTAGYVVATAASGVVSLASTVWNARSVKRLAGHRVRTLIGLAASGVNLGLGLASVGKDGAGRPPLAAFNLIAGGVSAILGFRALSAPSRVVATDAPRLSVAPVVLLAPKTRVGFSARLHF